MRTPIMLVLLVALTACGVEFGRPRVRTEKLSGGATRVINPPVGRWREGHGWQLRKLLTIGTVDGDSAEVFGSIADIEVGADGRIYVLDRQSKDLRIFGPDGTHMRSGGRAGSGPGEFGNPFGMEWLPGGDSLLIADPQVDRYSILDHDGNFVRSTQRPITSFGWMFRGGFANGRLYEASSWRSPAGSGSGLVGMKLGAQAELGDTLRYPEPSAPPIPAFAVRNERGGMFISVPHAPGTTWDLTTAGDLWWGYSGDYRILRLDLKGDTVLEIVVEGGTPQPVTAAELAEWMASENVRTFKERGGAIDESRIPKHKPYFTDLYADPEGNLWVDVPSSDGLTVFDVFDQEGRRLGQVASGVKRDPTVKPRVRNNRLYLAGQGDADVPQVYVFAIER